MVIAKGAIGLWGRIHVAVCPYCKEKHFHDDAQPDDAVDAPCGLGKYSLDCRKEEDFVKDYVKG